MGCEGLETVEDVGRGRRGDIGRPTAQDWARSAYRQNLHSVGCLPCLACLSF